MTICSLTILFVSLLSVAGTPSGQEEAHPSRALASQRQKVEFFGFEEASALAFVMRCSSFGVHTS